MTRFDPAGRVLAAELSGHLDRDVLVMGRVLAVRSHGKVVFLDLFDRTGKMQLVTEADGDATLPTPQSLVSASGRVIANPQAPQGAEVKITDWTVVAALTVALPFNPVTITPPLHAQGPNLETVLDHRTLSFRCPANFALLRITSAVLAAFDAFCREHGFVEIKSPKLVAGGTEGGANMFEVKYFDRAAFLAQSPQLYKQSLASTLVERVFEVGPAFRAEKHESSRHLNEFTGLDVEVSYPKDMFTLMEIEEALLHRVVATVGQSCAPELEHLGASLPALALAFPRLSLDEAKEISTGSCPTRSRPAEDMTQEDERAVCEWAHRTHGCDAVFVHSFPTRNRPFYTMPLADNPRKSGSFDLLLRGLEISSGSIRIHDPAVLEANLRRLDLDPADFTTYLEIFRTGCPPHGGFGIGLERLVAKLLDFPNVRYATSFPRDRHRLEP